MPRLCAALSFILLGAVPGMTQTGGAQPDVVKSCPLGVKVPENLTIRSVQILGRRGVGRVEEQLRAQLVGKIYTSALHDEAMRKVDDELTKEANQTFEKEMNIVGASSRTKSGVAAMLMNPCVEYDEAAKWIDVSVRVLSIRADLANPANNLLTLPRSLAPSFYNKMPPFLRAFNPQADVAFDRRTGLASSLDLSTDLLELNDLWEGKPTSDSDVRLDLNFSGEKALSKRFYVTDTKLKLSKARPGLMVENLNFNLGFRANDQPLTGLRHVNRGLRLGGQIKLRPRLGLLNSVYLSGDYSRNLNKVFDRSLQVIGERDHKGSFRSLFDGRAGGGFARAGVWFDTTAVSRNSTRYRRLAGLLGYQKEIGEGTQTVGIEAVFGAGKSWGEVPLYARFYGGNNTGNFLYEAPEGPAMTELPAGPLLRSYGKSQAGADSSGGVARGGRAYWHANFNFTIPVRPWSRPLIPNETIADSDGDVKLSRKLENFAIGSAVGGIADDLLDAAIAEVKKNDPALGEDEAEQEGVKLAQKRATELAEKEIAPAIRFIARRANIFAVKPLIMLDAAKLDAFDGDRGRTRFAAGGGLQFVVVIARAEMGYMRSLPTIPGESKGNFVFRLTFQNIF
jgi:hypothetical protein